MHQARISAFYIILPCLLLTLAVCAAEEKQFDPTAATPKEFEDWLRKKVGQNPGSPTSKPPEAKENGGATLPPPKTPKPTPPGKVALRFPFKFSPGLTLRESDMQARSVAKPTGGTSWNISGQVVFKSFQPTRMALGYWDGKLYQVTVSQEEIRDCTEMNRVYMDAVGFLAENYSLEQAAITKGAAFGSTRCRDYMDEGRVTWQARSGDYAAVLDTFWHDGGYHVYVAYIFAPIAEKKAAEQKEEQRKKGEGTRSNL